ncbi:hypothetical protein HRbin36_01733 [bacterium HR36]|nr:hypothetical protein HRbin36_01733 [bacterium HR36]
MEAPKLVVPAVAAAPLARLCIFAKQAAYNLRRKSSDFVRVSRVPPVSGLSWFTEREAVDQFVRHAFRNRSVALVRLGPQDLATLK